MSSPPVTVRTHIACRNGAGYTVAVGGAVTTISVGSDGVAQALSPISTPNVAKSLYWRGVECVMVRYIPSSWPVNPAFHYDL